LQQCRLALFGDLRSSPYFFSAGNLFRKRGKIFSTQPDLPLLAMRAAEDFPLSPPPCRSRILNFLMSLADIREHHNLFLLLEFFSFPPKIQHHHDLPPGFSA
jgi:hypothetical protein